MLCVCVCVCVCDQHKAEWSGVATLQLTTLNNNKLAIVEKNL